ncbi:MAG TPA: copper resistance protein B [Oxalicibacterium sp.]|nr:copper resistance protein B [Oxalicibacterium sp.]
MMHTNEQRKRTLWRPLLPAIAFAVSLWPLAGSAQSAMPHDMSSMHHMHHDDMRGADHGGMGSVKHGDLGGTDHGDTHGAPDSDTRDPDAYADGLEPGHMPGMDMADNATHAYLLLNRIETFRSNRSHGQTLDAQAWIGGDIDKAWFKLEGEREDGKLGSSRSEVLWDHAIASYWSLQTGIRHDAGDGPDRSWAAFGVQGLAPYWFDVEATAYLGENGRSAARLESSYDLRVTQRVVLQPDIEIALYGKDDRERGIGSGLSAVDVGLRLRYEVTRKFAPYAGLVWRRTFSGTADYAREAGDAVEETRIVAGLHAWF